MNSLAKDEYSAVFFQQTAETIDPEGLFESGLADVVNAI